MSILSIILTAFVILAVLGVSAVGVVFFGEWSLYVLSDICHQMASHRMGRHNMSHIN